MPATEKAPPSDPDPRSQSEVEKMIRDPLGGYNTVWTLSQRLQGMRLWLRAHPLLKEGERNDVVHYRYVAWDDLSTDAVFAQFGLLLIPSCEGFSTEPSGETKSGATIRGYSGIVKLVLTNVDNPEDRLEMFWPGEALDAEAKGLAKLTTSAVKDFFLKGLQIAGADSADVAAPASVAGQAAAGRDLSWLRCPYGHPLKQGHGQKGEWVSCTAWFGKNDSRNCTWRGPSGTLAQYADKLEEQERLSKPAESGEFTPDPDGIPRPVTAGEAEQAAAVEPKAQVLAPLEGSALEIVELVKERDPVMARGAIIGGGGAAMIESGEGESWTLKGAVLRIMTEKNRQSVVAALKLVAPKQAELALSEPEGDGVAAAVSHDRAVTGDSHE
jgi:hypothetical protein